MQATAELDAQFMALALAEAARGHPSPSPRVGAVVVRDGDVVGLGHRARAAAPTAEASALEAAGSRARGATLYVTLAPSESDLILASGIARVVIAAPDPRPDAPSGVERLRRADVRVDEDVCGGEGRELVADFAMLASQGRPLTVLKAAATLDGRIATRTGDSKWITGEPARAAGHALRDACGAVMVGVGTVLADDPRLDVRLVPGRDPIRIVLDTHLRTPARAHVITHELSQPTWIFHASEARDLASLAREGVELIPTPTREGHLDLAAVLAELGRRGVMRLLVEGGARVHGALIDQGLADRAVLFLAPMVLGDRAARSLAERSHPPDTIAGASRLEDAKVSMVGGDVRIDARFAAAKP